jgi:hypothetical protein
MRFALGLLLAVGVTLTYPAHAASTSLSCVENENRWALPIILGFDESRGIVRLNDLRIVQANFSFEKIDFWYELLERKHYLLNRKTGAMIVEYESGARAFSMRCELATRKF